MARRRAPKHRRKQSHSAQVEHVSGSTIKAARKRRHFTQRALASQLRKSQSRVRDVENGNGRFRIIAEDQARLCQALEI